MLDSGQLWIVTHPADRYSYELDFSPDIAIVLVLQKTKYGLWKALTTTGDLVEYQQKLFIKRIDFDE